VECQGCASFACNSKQQVHVQLLRALTVQIAISSRGVLRVTHMLTLAGGGPLAPLEAQPLLGTLNSQVVDVGCSILIMYTATATPLMVDL
jgi:hypothetical protein